MNKLLQLFAFIWVLLPLKAVSVENKHSILVDGISISLSGKAVSFASGNSTTDQDSIKIPLIRAGNLFFIEAQINHETGNFLVDLGAPYLVLNATYFRETERDENYNSGTLNSASDYVKRTSVKDFSFYGIHFTNLSADITDLGAIENRRGIKIFGLLGISLFNDFVFDIDVKKQQLILYKQHTKAPDDDLLLTTPIKIQNNVLLVKGKVNKTSLLFSIDTGAERNILDNNLPSGIYNGMKILGNSVTTDGNGRKSEVLVSEISNLSIQDIDLGKMASLILNLNVMSRAYDKQIDGMLGYPFFAKGRVVIDFKNKELMLFSTKGNKQ
jgi:predicted aspartyl protease